MAIECHTWKATMVLKKDMIPFCVQSNFVYGIHKFDVYHKDSHFQHIHCRMASATSSLSFAYPILPPYLISNHLITLHEWSTDCPHVFNMDFIELTFSQSCKIPTIRHKIWCFLYYSFALTTFLGCVGYVKGLQILCLRMFRCPKEVGHYMVVS